MNWNPKQLVLRSFILFIIWVKTLVSYMTDLEKFVSFFFFHLIVHLSFVSSVIPYLLIRNNHSFDEVLLLENFQDPGFSKFLESHDKGLKSFRNENAVS